jgi:hypothetical protein
MPWLKPHVYPALLPMNGNGSTRVHAASLQVRCFSIQMENVVRADVIVKTLQKQYVLHVQ